ncbi:UPF0538 protein C2orf76-like [Hydractinia symbiolongicarpus]|uniref:UPF0538 protein C2orf76-like n=1 Tax=Hydractinia symbiolongicarpus TaxID=13093 RepID=UPI00254F9A3D|nr:UPF0538 protein C2orf76-like [Hydractinia symbiolongicarpus]
MSSYIITVRLIRSFEYRNIRNVVYHHVDLNQTGLEFINFVKEDILKRTELPAPFRKHLYNAMKIEQKQFGSKTNDPVINNDNDEELRICEHKTLIECGVGNETVISFYNNEEYEKYKHNPQHLW